MTHIRQQLRGKIVDIVTTALAVDGATVYVNRQSAIEEDKLPAVVITTNLDRRRPADIHNGYDADIDLSITIYQKDILAVDDKIDALCAKIEAATQADTTIDGTIELQETGIDFVDADKITVAAQMNYLITLYGIDDAETVI